MRGQWVLGHVVWVLGLFLLTGLIASLVWVWLWTPAEGLVLDGRLVLLGDAPRHAFDGTGWFLIVSAAAGLIVGAVLGMLARHNELITLFALVVGALGAAVMMRWVGSGLGPPDPTPIAARSVDYTGMPVALELSGVIAMVALPISALAGFLTALVVVPPRRH